MDSEWYIIPASCIISDCIGRIQSMVRAPPCSIVGWRKPWFIVSIKAASCNMSLTRAADLTHNTREIRTLIIIIITSSIVGRRHSRSPIDYWNITSLILAKQPLEYWEQYGGRWCSVCSHERIIEWTKPVQHNYHQFGISHHNPCFYELIGRFHNSC